MTVQSGTWSAQYILTSGSVTRNVTTGKWFRLGSLCFFYGNLRTSSVSSPVGNVRLSLPFVSLEATPLGIGILDNWGAAITDIKCYTAGGAAQVVLLRNNTDWPVTASDLFTGNNGNAIQWGGFFEVAG
jgi:hypothetical protein